MKKIPPIGLVIIFLLFLSLKFPLSSWAASCNPPTDYSGCPELNPDLNLDISGYELINENPSSNLIPFVHEIDPTTPPQLSTLIAGNPNPAVTSLYQMHYWDWSTNSQGNLASSPSDLPSNFDFSTLVGFFTQPGQTIMVPNSGYDIGGGYEAVVIHANSKSITLKYTSDENVSIGYTLYLDNIQVDPNLLAYYNELNQAGRNELPALLAGMKIGKAMGAEILVAIRDTGMFLDPRWLNDWWQALPTELRELLLKSLILQPTPLSLACTPANSGDKYSRPIPCDPCNQARSFSSSCATSFTVNDKVKYRHESVDKRCQNNPWVERDWGGIVVVNPANTTIPFVGKREEEDEQKYLADYFEGTNEYYKNYSLYWRDWVNHGGVLRKLTPMEYQNQLKKEMVERAKTSKVLGGRLYEGGIHDYKLEYAGRLCWDFPFLIDALLAIAQQYEIPIEIVNNLLKTVSQGAHYCVFNELAISAAGAAIAAFNAVSPVDITTHQTTDETATLTALDRHFPPEPDEENYSDKWNAWKESDGGKWFKLWQVTPMVSRDDTPGQIFPYLGARLKDSFEIRNPLAQIEKVPHVARLYELSGELNKMLMPSEESQPVVQENKGPILASAHRPLLAQSSPPVSNCGGLQLSAGQQSDGSLGYSVEVAVPNPCYYSDCQTTTTYSVNGTALPPCQAFIPQIPQKGTPVPLPCQPPRVPGAQITVQFQYFCGRMGDPPGCVDPYFPQDGACSCASQVVNGALQTTCGVVVPPGPACGLPAPRPVNSCEKPAITDSNPNDNLCCDPIKINLSATDQFINRYYEECDYSCGLFGIELCNPSCKKEELEPVSREVGVNLVHPYLTDIWNQTAKTRTNGLFNLFRPASIPKFQEIDASSQINYSYEDTSDPPVGSVTPGVGKFYFNYLGGVQLAKEWVIRALTPYVD